MSRTPTVAAAWLGWLFLLSLPCLSHAQGSLRSQEIAECLPGEIMSWGDGRDRPAASSPMVFVYEHSAAPAWFEQTQVLAMVRKAADAWSQCGVPSVVLDAEAASTAGKDAVRIRWSADGSMPYFGLANFSQRTLMLGPPAFQLLKTRNPAHDARETLQMTISHEMGHLFGLMSHSRRCVDVTSNYDDGKGGLCHMRDRSQFRSVPEYRSSLPTACDIQRCRLANGTTDAKPGRP
jgi:hypothetical protein